jgi:subtilisin family serine protease
MPIDKRLRVAVIDSGVHASHPHIMTAMAGGVTLAMNGEVDDGVFVDRLGHGTAVMAAIQEKAPGAEYFAVKVFDRELRTTGLSLVRAIDWCADRGMDIVNLSLGTTNMAHREMFMAAVERAAVAGTLLVAAADAGGQPCLPGCLPGVIAVEIDPECPRDQYRVAGERLFRASGYPRPVPGVPPERNLNGISFAVANMTGLVAGAGAEDPLRMLIYCNQRKGT